MAQTWGSWGWHPGAPRGGGSQMRTGGVRGCQVRPVSVGKKKGEGRGVSPHFHQLPSARQVQQHITLRAGPLSPSPHPIHSPLAPGTNDNTNRACRSVRNATRVLEPVQIPRLPSESRVAPFGQSEPIKYRSDYRTPLSQERRWRVGSAGCTPAYELPYCAWMDQVGAQRVRMGPGSGALDHCPPPWPPISKIILIELRRPHRPSASTIYLNPVPRSPSPSTRPHSGVKQGGDETIKLRNDETTPTANGIFPMPPLWFRYSSTRPMSYSLYTRRVFRPLAASRA